MAAYTSEAVPFQQCGNRRCLTDQQLVENPALAEFVQRFRNSFEYCAPSCVWVFIEPEGQ